MCQGRPGVVLQADPMRIAIAMVLTSTMLVACGGKKKDDPPCTGAACVDTVAAPELIQLLPGATANDNGPRIIGSAEAGLTVRIYDDTACENVRASGTAAAFTSTGIQVPVLDESTTTFRARAERDDGLRSACSSISFTYVEDSTPPGPPTITAVSPTLSNTNGTVLFGDAPGAEVVQVFADAACTGALIASGSPTTFASNGIAIIVADDSSLTLRARSLDAVGNASPCSTSSATYVEDSTPPAFAGLVDARYDGSGAALSWDTAAEDVVYEVCRSDTRGGCDTFVTYDATTATTFADAGVASAATYYYRVGARDAAGNLATPRSERAVYIGCGTGFLASGSGCTWQHGPSNWDFDSSSTWVQEAAPVQIANGADACSPGVEGYAVIDRATTCGGGGLHQTFDMPTFEQGGGMELSIGYYYDDAVGCPDRCSGLNEPSCNDQYLMCAWTGSTCVSVCTTYDEPTCASIFGCSWNGSCEFNRFGGRCIPASVRASVGSRSFDAVAVQAPFCTQTTACLGDAQYGGAQDIALRTRAEFACSPLSDLEIRPARVTSLSIEPAQHCPAPGEAYNGELDFDAVGYGFPSGNTFEQGQLGEQGSRAARFNIATRCGRVSMSTWYSVPSATTAPALELWLARGSGSEVDVSITEGLGGLRLPATATGTQRICLPQGARGSAFPLTISGGGPGDSVAGSATNCGDAFATFVVVDSVRVANDARCTAASNVVNGDFELEASDLVTWWFNWAPTQSGGASAFPEIARGAVGRASDAAGHAQLDQCGQATMATAIAVIPPTVGGGAAVRAYYKYVAGTEGSASVGVSGLPRSALAPAADWTPTTLCLPQDSGPAAVSFTLTRFTACGASSPQELWVDDVEVVNDPSCP